MQTVGPCPGGRGHGQFHPPVGVQVRLARHRVRESGLWYPSAKTGSACGTVKFALLLSERAGRCHTCGFDGDRDLNAVHNIEMSTV